MERYETLFAQLKNRQEGAFRPLCHPWRSGPEQSLKIIDALIEGAPMPLNWGSLSPTRWRTARPSRARPCAPSPRE